MVPWLHLRMILRSVSMMSRIGAKCGQSLSLKDSETLCLVYAHKAIGLPSRVFAQKWYVLTSALYWTLSATWSVFLLCREFWKALAVWLFWQENIWWPACQGYFSTLSKASECSLGDHRIQSPQLPGIICTLLPLVRTCQEMLAFRSYICLGAPLIAPISPGKSDTVSTHRWEPVSHCQAVSLTLRPRRKRPAERDRITSFYPSAWQVLTLCIWWR